MVAAALVAVAGEQETAAYMGNERGIEVAATRKEAPKARFSLQLLALPRLWPQPSTLQPWWMKKMAGKRTSPHNVKIDINEKISH